jgi:hypothetical protein
MRLSEREARTLLLVQAVEETDQDGVLLPPRTRADATRRVFDDVSRVRDDQARLRARAALLREDLIREAPALAPVLEPTPRRRTVVLATLAVAMAIGVATNLFGPERHVSVLAFPLAGILVWNLAVYLGLGVRAVGRVMARVRGRGRPRGRLAMVAWLLEGPRLSTLARRLGGSTRSVAVTNAVERFQRLWLVTAAPLIAARVRIVLHLAAFSMALGAIVGMYVSGIAFEYRATWESTWLDTPAVQRYLGLVLGPAARVLDLPVPDVAPLRGPGGEGGAAPWIHLWATTLGLFVLIPRAALALFDALTAARLSRWLPVDIDAAYRRRALHSGRGAAAVVEIVYYSCQPNTELRERLHTTLQEQAGARAVIRDGATLEYGAGPERVTAMDDASTSGLLVLVFALAQTPEVEVHGEFLETMQSRADRAGWEMMIVLDMATYRQRVGSEERVRERRATWDRLLRDLQLTATELT